MRQKAFFVVLVVVIIGLWFSGEAFSQKTEADYNEVSKKARAGDALARSIPYRSTITGEKFESRDGKRTWNSVLIQELIPGESSRWIQTNDSPGTAKRIEMIWAGGKNYRKIDNGEWQSLPPYPDYTDTVREFSGPIHQGQKSAPKPRFTNQAWLIENVTLNGRNVSVYETKSTVVTTEGEKDITKINSSRFWLRDDGFLLKRVTELQTAGEKAIRKNTTVYEHENIKIEAPIP